MAENTSTNMAADKPSYSNPFAALAPVRNPFTPHTSDTDDNASSSSAIVLRPSALTPKTLNMGRGLKCPLESELSNCDKSFTLKPALLHNPLAANAANFKQDKGHSSTDQTIPDNPFCRTETNGQTVTEDVPSLVSVNNAFTGENQEPTPDCQPATSSLSSCSPSKQPPTVVRNFVFGSNLGDRVVNARTSCESTSDNEDTSNLFTHAPTSAGSGDEAPSSSSTSLNDEAPYTSPGKSLEESAKEYQAKHAAKEYEQVACQTGEEKESNVLHANCKLYLFNNVSRSWSEKGRGLLRVNDMLSFDGGQSFQSRIVMRTQGSFKLILNTKIWCEMMMEKASNKSLRFTAQDEDGSIKIYLLSTSPKDAEHIFRAVDWRIQQIRSRAKEPDQTAHTGRADNVDGDVNSEAKFAEKRPADDETPVESLPVPMKKNRTDEESMSTPAVVGQTRRVHEESNDSSTAEPCSEASNSTHSSPTIKSTSSE